MEYYSFDIQGLRTCQMNLLKAVIQACEKLGISYFLDHGTLIGAVRHHGYIPWDDDIDIGMLRADYDVFIEHASEYLPDYYFLQTHKTDPEFLNNFAKLRDERTTYIETKCKYQKIHQGVFVDIFPFDYYPEGKLRGKIFRFRRKLLKRRIEMGFYYDEPLKLSRKGKMMANLSKVLYPDIYKAVEAREKLIRSVPESRFVWCTQGLEKAPLNWLNKTVDLSFENIAVKGPKEYDQYLRAYYGDYMQLPPVEEQVGHHYAEAVDLHEPYTKYIK